MYACATHVLDIIYNLMTSHLCITPTLKPSRNKSVAIIPPEIRCEIQIEAWVL